LASWIWSVCGGLAWLGLLSYGWSMCVWWTLILLVCWVWKGWSLNATLTYNVPNCLVIVGRVLGQYNGIGYWLILHEMVVISFNLIGLMGCCLPSFLADIYFLLSLKESHKVYIVLLTTIILFLGIFFRSLIVQVGWVFFILCGLGF
jgi:hypothetical protein